MSLFHDNQKPVSLWDMIEFCLRDLLNHLEALQGLIEGPLLDEMKRDGSTHAFPPHTWIL